MNATSRPRQRMRASAYATGIDESSSPVVARTEYIIVFSVQRHSGAFVNTSTKFWSRKGWGHRLDESAWLVVISDVSTMKRNGARNAIAIAIKTLCRATESRNRLRRTAGGGRRRTRVAGTAEAVNAVPPGEPTCAS